MLEQGYIKLHRSISGWCWYRDPKVLALWVHILLSANYEPRGFADRVIERGQLATSLASLSEKTGLSTQEVRTALGKLKKTGEVTVWSNRHMTVITIKNYDEYQSSETDNQQTDNKPSTNHQQTVNRQSTTMKESKKARKQEIKKECSVTLPPDTGFSDELLSAVTEWLDYKRERREDYKATGLKSLLTQIKGKADTHGDSAVCTVIRLSMSNNWKGIIWDRIESSAPAPQSYDYGGNSL